MPRLPVRLPAALLAAAFLLASRPAAPATYFVDVANGVDDAGRDGLSAATAWRSLTFAMSRIRTAGPHEVQLAPGDYSEATGEDFPLAVLPDVSILGAGPGLTRFLDAGGGAAGTLRWSVRPANAPAAAPTFSGFTVERAPHLGQPAGAGLEIDVLDLVMSPRLTNLVLRGAALGLDMEVVSETVDATLSPAIEACRFFENGIGVLSTAYTALGDTARADPSFLNCVAMRNLSDGMVFETKASWDLVAGQRVNALSAPILTHCTLAENLGSGMLLDNSNGYVRYRSGAVTPVVTNSILTGNGDYALHEYTSTTDPATFDRNLVGGNLVALYRNEGTTDEVAVGGLPGAGNVDAAALFQRSLDPDFHLRGDSPGVDALGAGLFAATDADGQARPIDGDGNGSLRGDMGADEAQPCAVAAALDPPAPVDRCGRGEPPQDLSALASAMAAGFTCAAPLAYEWYADGVLFSTDPTVAVVPPATTVYAVVVRCPDLPYCSDSRSARIVVHELPIPDAEAGLLPTPTGDYEACVAWDATDVTVDLLGSAEPFDDSASITSTSWSAVGGILLGGSLLNAQVVVTNTGDNQVVPVTLTATDSHGCSAQSASNVHVWRGPRPITNGPYTSCQDVGQPQTFIPLDGAADLPAGSNAVRWTWTTDVGQFEDTNSSTTGLENPRLKLTNFSFNRTANLTMSVTDDHGCSATASTTLTLLWTPAASANGPYQEPEAAVSPTIFTLSGTFTGPPGSVPSWTTDLGTFQSTGTQSADGADQVLEVPNTGADQLGQVCFVVTPPSGTCPATDCTAVSVRVSPPQPPNDIGGTLRLQREGSSVRLSWLNPPLDGSHDRADAFDVWESESPGPGAWTPRPTLQDVPRDPGTTSVLDATLLDPAGPDLLFLKVVSQNGGGLSCADPASELPDCPSLEDCANGVDDDGDRLVDCADPGCPAGTPPC